VHGDGVSILIEYGFDLDCSLPRDDYAIAPMRERPPIVEKISRGRQLATQPEDQEASSANLFERGFSQIIAPSRDARAKTGGKN
jgi:hypothetical protein